MPAWAGATALLPFLGQMDLASIAHGLVTTRLDCCHALYVALPLEMTQTTAHAAECGCTNAEGRGGGNKYDHITSILRELH